MDLKSYLLGKSSMSGEGSNTPTATVTQTDNGAIITITDKNGTTTATIVNGKDGADGEVIDLSEYATKEYVNTAIGEVQKTLSLMVGGI